MIEFITVNWQNISLAITSVISAAAAVAALTPTPKDDSIVKKIRKVIDVLGLNIKNAKNRDD